MMTVGTESYIFVGFNRRVAALDRRSGEVVWEWRAPKGHGYVSLLLDGVLLFAAVQGYIYCLDPRTGEQLWLNPMRGFGHGVTCIATAGGHTDHGILQQAAHATAQAAAAGGTAGAGAS